MLDDHQRNGDHNGAEGEREADTDDRIALHDLIGKATEGDFLREMIGFAAQRLMELEVDALTGAGYGERSDDRVTKRNGYRERTWVRWSPATGQFAKLGSP